MDKNDSLSFSSVSEKEVDNNVTYQTPIFDPTFMSIKVLFPLKYENIFKNISTIPFLYELTEETTIVIRDLYTNRTITKISTDTFELFDFTVEASPLYFIFGKDKYKTSTKVETNKKFKESIKTKSTFVAQDNYKAIKERYLNYQIKNLVNFVFIESSEHLHSQIKSFVSLYKEKEEYIPKTKKFNETQKQLYIKNLIQMISGVSESIGNAIVEAYPSIGNLQKGLLDRETFCSLKIVDEGSVRNIPEKVYKKLYSAFLEDTGDKRI